MKQESESGGKETCTNLRWEAREGKAAHRAERGRSVPDERKSMHTGTKAGEEPRYPHGQQ